MSPKVGAECREGGQCVASERPGVQNGAFDITSDAKICLFIDSIYVYVMLS